MRLLSAPTETPKVLLLEGRVENNEIIAVAPLGIVAADCIFQQNFLAGAQRCICSC